MTYTDEFLISELHRFVRENSRVPKMYDLVVKKGYPSYQAYRDHFGSFNSGLETANLEINQTNKKRNGTETCCICKNYLKLGEDWLTKGLLKGEVICMNCYQKSKRDYMNGNLDKNSAVGVAFISQRVVANVLGLELKYDCNCVEGFKHSFDLYDRSRYNYINVKDSKLHYTIERSPAWHFGLTQKIIPDTYIMLGYDKNRKNVLRVWITDAIDDFVFNEKKGKTLTSKTITNVYESLDKAKPWEVDPKPYDDMLHQMSEKRKATNGTNCVLSNDDLRSE